MAIIFEMPSLSPTMEKGNLVTWCKNEGDEIAVGDVIAEIDTDKATMEVESIHKGVLAKILVQAGTHDVTVRTPIAIIKQKNDTEEDIKNVTEDILDRFGKMPKEMFSLIGIARIKEKCKNMGITKVTQKENKIIFYFDSESFTLNIPDLIEHYNNRIKFSTGINPYITFTLRNVNSTIEEIEEFLK